VAKQWSPLVGGTRELGYCNRAYARPIYPHLAHRYVVGENYGNSWRFVRPVRCRDRKILFLAGTAGGSAIRSCETDKNFFLVPLINVECSESEPPDFFQTYAEQRACAKGFADAFTDLKLVIDGHPFDGDFHSLRVQAKGHFTPVEGNIFGTPPANNSKFAADGYWALIKLTPDVHTLTFGGSYVPVPGEPPAFTTDVTYTLTVQN
jgi:hypothetical protein